MKNYEYMRDLDGSAVGTVRAFVPGEVAALVASGALIATDKPVTADVLPAQPVPPIAPVTQTETPVAIPAVVPTPRPPRSGKSH